MSRISFSRPYYSGNEFAYIKDAIDRMHVSGDGYYTHRCHDMLCEILGAPKALLTTSCTDALEMAALLLEIREGDEVIVPSFTFVSTVNAFVLRGARPVFIDIRPDTLNLDESRLESLITDRTKAILVVHYAGVGCEMDAIMEIAARHGVPVVEDNAHGLFGAYKGKPLGTFGCLATLSFHETKNVACGEGGALIINDLAHLERAEILREKGTNRSKYFRGEVDKYSWVDIGSSFLPSDILAAYLCAQLEARERIQSRRRDIWNTYLEGLEDWAAKHDVRLPVVPAHCQQAYHMFYLLLPNVALRDSLIACHRARDIVSVFHYQPLHLSIMGRRFGGASAECPVTEDVADRLVRLPFFNSMSDDEQAEVIETVMDFLP